MLRLVDELGVIEPGVVFQDHLDDAVGERRRALFADVALHHRRPAAAPGDQQMALREHGRRRGGGQEDQVEGLPEPGAVGQPDRGAVAPKGRVEGGQGHAVEVENPAHLLRDPSRRLGRRASRRRGRRAQGDDLYSVARQSVIRQLGAMTPVDEDQSVGLGQSGDAPFGNRRPLGRRDIGLEGGPGQAVEARVLPGLHLGVGQALLAEHREPGAAQRRRPVRLAGVDGRLEAVEERRGPRDLGVHGVLSSSPQAAATSRNSA